jgi:hypothetical protein
MTPNFWFDKDDFSVLNICKPLEEESSNMLIWYKAIWLRKFNPQCIKSVHGGLEGRGRKLLKVNLSYFPRIFVESVPYAENN